MTFLSVLEVINYGLVLIYGFFLSLEIAGGLNAKKERAFAYALCPALLLVQALCSMALGVETVRRLYPLIVHLPLVLMIVFLLKKTAGMALVSVCTAYLCCQLPRVAKLILSAVSGSALIGEIGYMMSILPLFFLLCRYFVHTAHSAMTYSSRLLALFGSLPIAYYIFDYAAAVYSDALYVGAPVLAEFLPSALIAFYVVYLAAYHAQAQKRADAELQSSMLEAELKQSGAEIENLRRGEMQAAIYRHDMRHHLAAIEGFLASGKHSDAEGYIQKVQTDMEKIATKRFCGNELVNLLCNSFASKAERMEIRFAAEVRLPGALSVSDTELCTILSNGLENALCAAGSPEVADRWVKLYCEIRRGKLLIEIRNPYAGEVTMQDGLPRSDRPGHGYGCRSIRTIAERCGGLCSFEPQNGIFTLRAVLPNGSGTE